MQARFTDLIIFNKWELVDERHYEDCLDRIGDLEVQVATVKSDRGKVDQDLLMGLDSALAKAEAPFHCNELQDHHAPGEHNNEVEVLSLTMDCQEPANQTVNLEKLQSFLSSAPKDEIYRIKALLSADQLPSSSSDSASNSERSQGPGPIRCILNWAFGRWTFTPLIDSSVRSQEISHQHILRMTIVLARFEADKWATLLKSQGQFVPVNPEVTHSLDIKRLS